MASHLSTPETVLVAPSLTRTVVSSQRGFTRRERRHGVPVIEGLSAESKRLYYAEVQAEGPNRPHVGPVDPERAAQLAGRRKARHRSGLAAYAAPLPEDLVEKHPEERQIGAAVRAALASFDWKGRGA